MEHRLTVPVKVSVTMPRDRAVYRRFSYESSMRDFLYRSLCQGAQTASVSQGDRAVLLMPRHDFSGWRPLV